MEAANEFLYGKIDTSTNTGENVNKLLNIFRNIIKGINNILLVLLAGLSSIALAVVGIRYLISGASPEQKRIAKDSLHTVFKGMLIGFGAFIIWRIAIGFIEIMFRAFGVRSIIIKPLNI